MKRMFIAGGVATLLGFMPLGLDMSADPTEVVSLQVACGQASSCIKQDDFICSTYHNDYEGYACYTGCDSQN